MSSFSYSTSAELFPAAVRKKRRGAFTYRRFETAADAIRFAMEELPKETLTGTYMQVDEARFDHSGIRSLYQSDSFPLPRKCDESIDEEEVAVAED